MKSRLYLETTVPSYLVSRPSADVIVAAHQKLTREWWTKRISHFDVYVSQFVINEAADGDPLAASERLKAIKPFALLDANDDVFSLASSLVLSGVIPEKAGQDASHIAVAAVHGMRYLLTWNCKHIANAELKGRIVDVCGEFGYHCPLICTPEELLGE